MLRHHGLRLPQAKISNGAPSNSLPLNFFTLAYPLPSFPLPCGLQTNTNLHTLAKDTQSYLSAYRNHVRHGHVLGRAAGCSVCSLFCNTTPKTTLLILICRTLTAITVALSVPVHMYLIDAYYVAWITGNVFTLRSLPEIWRFVTPFFITAPKFGLLMDPYFLWTYASQLELEASRFSQPGDFFTYVTFVCSVILVSRVHPLRLTNRRLLLSYFPFFSYTHLPYCPASLS